MQYQCAHRSDANVVTAVVSFEGLKPSLSNQLSKVNTVVTAVVSFEGLKPCIEVFWAY